MARVSVLDTLIKFMQSGVFVMFIIHNADLYFFYLLKKSFDPFIYFIIDFNDFFLLHLNIFLLYSHETKVFKYYSSYNMVMNVLK